MRQLKEILYHGAYHTIKTIAEAEGISYQKAYSKYARPKRQRQIDGQMSILNDVKEAADDGRYEHFDAY